MPTLIFDIETAGEDFEKMDSASQEVLTKWIKENSRTEEEYKQELERLKLQLGFSPYAAEIVSIAVLDYEREKGKVYFQAPGKEVAPFTADNYEFEAMSEPEMLKRFWQGAENYESVVTFNGRGFDVPFLMIRSAIHNIRPSVNLMDNRYLNSQRPPRHIDLQDQLTFYGAFYKKGGLHMISRAFGIESPKKEGEVKGEEVGQYFAEGKYEEIARYNVRDVDATAKLYEYWTKYLRF